MRAFLAVLAAWLFSASLACAQMMGISGGPFTVSSYTGPGDIQSGASFFYGVMAYSSAQANTSTKALNARCNSGANAGTTFDVNFTSSGLLNTATAFNTCAQDGTFTATAATTVLTITALASGQVTVGDQFSYLASPDPLYIVSAGTCVSGAVVPPCTFNINRSLTVSVGTSMLASGGVHVTKWYDQIAANNCGGLSCDQLNGTASQQPLLLANCLATVPCVANNSTLSTSLSSANNFTPATGVTSAELVFLRIAVGGTASAVTRQNAGNNRFGGNGTANQEAVTGGASGVVSATANYNTPHSITAVLNASSSFVNVDGTQTTGTASGNTTAGAPVVGISTLNALVFEAGWWDNTAITNTVANSNCHNASARYSLGFGC